MKNVFRQTINLSQEELADLLDISKSAVGMYESGRRRLTATVEIRLQLLKDFWALFLKERTSASTLLSKELPDFKKFKTLLESCIQKASADALRYSQLLEKMNKDKIQLEEKLLFVRYLMLQPDAGVFPKSVLKKMQTQLKKRLKTCDAGQQQILVFQLNSCTVLQQLALNARWGLR